jgi:hypothetical protein
MTAHAIYLNCNRAVYLNFKYGVFLNMAESLNIKMAEITRWRYFKYGGLFDYLNTTKVRHFMERGRLVVR